MSPLREQIARIIEPWAMNRAECDPQTEEIRAEAYEKADQVLALLPLQPEEEQGAETGK